MRTLARCRNEAAADLQEAFFSRMHRWAVSGGLGLCLAVVFLVMQIRPAAPASENQKKVQEAFEVVASGSVADAMDAHDGRLAEGGGERTDEGCSGGGDQLYLRVGRVGGQAAEEVRRRRGGDGEVPVGAVDGASTDVERGAEPSVNGEGMDACGGGYDVDDSVDCAYLVEVDLFDVYVVDFGFGGSEELEGMDRGLLYFVGQIAGLDDLADCAQVASVMVMGFLFGFFVVSVRLCMVVSVRVVVGVRVMSFGRGVFLGGLGSVEDVDAGRGDAAAVDFFDLEGGTEIEGGDGVVEDLGGESGVEESAEEHVSADAGKAVEIGDAHGVIVSCADEAAVCVGARDCRVEGRRFERYENYVAWARERYTLPAGSRTQ